MNNARDTTRKDSIGRMGSTNQNGGRSSYLMDAIHHLAGNRYIVYRLGRPAANLVPRSLVAEKKVKKNEDKTNRTKKKTKKKMASKASDIRWKPFTQRRRCVTTSTEQWMSREREREQKKSPWVDVDVIGLTDRRHCRCAPSIGRLWLAAWGVYRVLPSFFFLLGLEGFCNASDPIFNVDERNISNKTWLDRWFYWVLPSFFLRDHFITILKRGNDS